VLPVLKRLNPRIIETLAAEATLLRDENDAVEAYLGTLTETGVTQTGDAISVKRDLFDMLPPAFRRRLLRQLVNRTDVDASLLSLGQIDDALSFMLSTQTGRTMHLPHSLAITREYDRFILGMQKETEAFSCTLTVPGTTEVPRLGLEVVTTIADNRSSAQEDAIYLWQAEFDYDKIQPLLTLRSRRAGDWFCPAGMGGRSKKLQDYFVDEKVPRRKRDTVPLLCAGEHVLWVVGLRTDERFLAGSGTKKVLVVQVKQLSR